MIRRSAFVLAAGVFAVFAAAPVRADNLATVQSIYAAFGRGDIPAILALLSDDIAWDHGHEGTTVPLLAPRTGPEEVGGFFQALGDLEFRKFQVLNLMAAGDQVAAVVDIDVIVKATGKEVADQEVHLWTFGEDGKVTAFRHFTDTEQFAAAMVP